MKTLLFTLEYPPFHGGVANYYENLVNCWQGDIAVLDNRHNLINKSLPLAKWAPSFFKLYNKIKLEKIDHIIVGNILPLGIPAWLLSKILKIKYSIILHGTDIMHSRLRARKKIITQKILDSADKIIVNSHYTENLLKQNYNAKNLKIAIINPGVSKPTPVSKEILQSLRLKYNPENKFLLLSLGRLVKRKGVDKTIEALDILSRHGLKNNFIYLIAGTGPDEEYLKKLAGHSPDINFLGPIAEQEKWGLLNLCDVFVLPGRIEHNDVEGFGIVFLEAALCAKPVIAGNSGGSDDAVMDDKTGIIVEGRDALAISLAIEKLFADSDLRLRLGNAARLRAEKEFSWSGQINKLQNFISN